MTPLRFLIKFATRGRPEYFKRAIQNIQETISNGANYFILASADLNDSSMNNDAIKKFCDDNHVMCVFGHSANKIQAINADMDMIGDWDILINMSDDMHWQVNGWDNVITNHYREHFPNGDAFMHYNDGYAGEALATMSIMDRKYYERDGYIYHNSYRSFSADAESYYVAILRGCHRYFPLPILFLHQHSTNTPARNDATYTMNAAHTPHDTVNYFERLNNNFYTGFEGVTIFDKFKTTK